jgi:heat shock protein HslJ
MAHLLRVRRLLLLAVMALLSGCGDGWLASNGGELSGSSWRLVGWSVSSLQATDFTITAAFRDGEISGSTAVNQYTGGYIAEDGAFATRDVSMTERAGPEPAMRAERIYVELLRTAAKYHRTRHDLVLMSANGDDLLYFRESR